MLMITCTDIVSRQIPPKAALTILNSPQLSWGAEHQEIKGSSPDHFSPTGREEEVGWPRETRTNTPDLSSVVKAFVSANIQLFWEVLELMNFCHAYKVSVCRLV